MQTASSLRQEPRSTPLPPPAVTASVGRLAVRLAESASEVAAAQALRYRVFYEEMKALPSAEMAARRQDFDSFDDACDHLLVVDRDRPSGEEVVGTYRLIREEVAKAKGGFYSSSEYDLSSLVGRQPNARFLELGRSCVDPEYRNNTTIQLLWRGITAYILAHGIDYMFGCGSLPGTDPDALALPLSYLHHEFLAPPHIRVRAQDHLFVNMDRMPREAINPRAALRTLPPLIKGYLRLGGYVGEGAVVDRQFNTTDVFILVPVDRIADRYQTRLEVKVD